MTITTQNLPQLDFPEREPIRLATNPELWRGQLCTSLFYLAPCGFGTELQESLPSYLERLADLHSAPPRAFLLKWLRPVAIPLTPEPRRMVLAMLIGRSPSEAIAAKAAELAGLHSINRLSPQIANWARIDMQDIRSNTAWCAECLREWKNRGTAIYKPLLWAFRWATHCPVHRITLIDRCPSCSFRQNQYTFGAGNGECQKCGGSLCGGLPATNTGSAEKELELKRSLRLAEFVRWNVSSDGISAAKDFYRKNLRTLQTAMTGKKLSQITGFNSASIYRMVTTEKMPDFKSIVRLTTAFDAPVQQWLSSLIPAEVFSRPHLSSIELAAMKPRGGASSPEQARQALQDALVVPSGHPVSLRQVALQLQVSINSLHKWEPNLAREVIERFTTARRLKAEKRQLERIRVVQDTVAELLSFKVKPNIAQVMKRLEDKNIRCLRICREIARIELGYAKRG